MVKRMPEFIHKKCGGTVFYLMGVNDFKKGMTMNLYACNRCHRVWWDALNNPISQRVIDMSDS